MSLPPNYIFLFHFWLCFLFLVIFMVMKHNFLVLEMCSFFSLNSGVYDFTCQMEKSGVFWKWFWTWFYNCQRIEWLYSNETSWNPYCASVCNETPNCETFSCFQYFCVFLRLYFKKSHKKTEYLLVLLNQFTFFMES